MRNLLTLVISVALAGSTLAQDSEKPAVSFEKIQLKAGELVGNYKTKQMVERLEGGVELLFIAKDPAENMTINCGTIGFRYDESSEADTNTPSIMELNGDIVIKAQGMLITSQKAIIDLNKMEADFVGYTEILRAGDESPAQAERVIVNFDTGDIRMLKAFFPSIELLPKKESEKSQKK